MRDKTSRWVERARRVLEGEPVTRKEALAILQSSETDEILEGAFVLRERHHGRGVKLHVLMNAKSGLCPENCSFCSQSAYASTPIEEYKLVSQEDMIQAAQAAKDSGAWRF